MGKSAQENLSIFQDRKIYYYIHWSLPFIYIVSAIIMTHNLLFDF